MSSIQQGSSNTPAGTAALTQQKRRDAWRQPILAGRSLCHTCLLPQALRKYYQVMKCLREFTWRVAPRGSAVNPILTKCGHQDPVFLLTSGSISGFSLKSDGTSFPFLSLLPRSKQVVITLSCLDSSTKINKGFLSQKFRFLTFKFNVQGAALRMFFLLKRS